MKRLASLSDDIKQYLVVTGNYWAFTLTDGALRMLVVLHFHALGYSPLSIAMLFLFYEIFGVVTNLVGGFLGARLGLNKTMNIGLAIQIIALLMLAVPAEWLTVVYVMIAQALSGIAKDLNKMSAKSSIKMLVAAGQEGTLFKWVAVLTGSKNALKGVGFFLGGLLLTLLSFKGAMLLMAGVLALVWCYSLYALKNDLGKAKNKPKFTDIFSKSRSINILSAARLFLFGARDVWFVVALPVFLSQAFEWDHWSVGSFLALWVIGYGIVQSMAPKLINFKDNVSPSTETVKWASLLALVTLGIALSLYFSWEVKMLLIAGLMVFGILFAVNSSLHSYLIVSMADADGVSLDVGFYYMANAMGRLFGTVLSGWVFQLYGLAACLAISFAFISLAALISAKLPDTSKKT
ncbi:organoarsenical effux MFS transporter ArsJ [Pseudoalteromonas sp. Of11M-6]|uniref:organoarsenical effux MFS transporter ArsJ n=1 Tax=Pseudoalteromonas sp. Of11M-6 TaxID=2917754 RepID=UPI001EF3EDB0|nr:organoarsenical effux MFS transporter ArsJ [Pseudoalteromonas sp. Of11M-6]MCG7556215.1 organoarsenical effux MFS transporter ArsJ [Pseudoalteromonas sp. Of11M-6]